ncbi:hypothetical protein ACFQXA_01685 [Nocardiopsis composta]
MLRVSLVLDRPLSPPGARRGFATLLPAGEDPLLGVVTADHNKHPGRVPAGRGLVSLVASPAGAAELLDAPDAADRLAARAERFLPGLTGRIRAARAHRFRHGLPAPGPDALRARPAFADRPPAAVDYAGDWVALRPCSEGRSPPRPWRPTGCSPSSATGTPGPPRSRPPAAAADRPPSTPPGTA